MSTPISKLIEFYGTQERTAEAMGVSQASVSGWSSGRHGMSEIHALRAERLTDGAVSAVELCPRLREAVA